MVAARSRGHGAARRMFFRAVADMVPAFSAGLSGKCCGKACGIMYFGVARHECLPTRGRGGVAPCAAEKGVANGDGWGVRQRNDPRSFPLISPFGTASPQGEAFTITPHVPPFLHKGDIRAKITRARKIVPFYTSSRTNVRDLPGCCSLSLAGRFLVAKAPTSPQWGSCAASSKCSCKQAFLLASGGMTGEGTRPR